MSLNKERRAKAEFERERSDLSRFATDVLVGLSISPKSLPCKYLYDTEGSRLFQRIMELPEYYLTRCEFEILSYYRQRLAAMLRGKPFHLIELGAGDGRKTKLLIECFLGRELRFKYVPIDICREAIGGLINELGACYPSLDMEGLVCEYAEGLDWLSDLNGKAVNLVLFLGSTIGNLTHSEARVFMHNLWKALNPGDYVLIGFDLKKDIRVMNLAYNDSRGITAEFNRNLLRRINRELGGDFDPARFSYFSSYNVRCGAVESFLVSREKQDVHLAALKTRISFEPWEPLQTEFSHKYLESEVEAIALETGFYPIEHALDSRGYFMDSLWQVRKH
jgi:dimethylhistidine N-methyltransferase